MINKLVAFGCSNTFGAEANNDYEDSLPDNVFYAYPWYLAQHLDIARDNYFNYAKSGCSNLEIGTTFLRTISSYDPKETFVVIGWTDDNRIPLSYSTDRISQISLHRVYEQLSWQNRIKHTKLYKKYLVQSPKKPKSFTLTQAIVKLIYSKLLQLPETPKNLLKFNYDYYEKNIRPYFSNDFIIGVEKHIFNTKNYSQSQLFIKMAVDSFLREKGYSYIMLSTKYVCDRDFINVISAKNYYDWKEHGIYINIIHEFGVKYGMSQSGNHMKWQAHKKLAEVLYEVIQERKILQ